MQLGDQPSSCWELALWLCRRRRYWQVAYCHITAAVDGKLRACASHHCSTLIASSEIGVAKYSLALYTEVLVCLSSLIWIVRFYQQYQHVNVPAWGYWSGSDCTWDLRWKQPHSLISVQCSVQLFSDKASLAALVIVGFIAVLHTSLEHSRCHLDAVLQCHRMRIFIVFFYHCYLCSFMADQLCRWQWHDGWYHVPSAHSELLQRNVISSLEQSETHTAANTVRHWNV